MDIGIPFEMIGMSVMLVVLIAPPAIADGRQ